MIARIRKHMEEKEEGFTLVELLVVIIIIGILAAIAIPLYLNQQAKAKDSSLKSDLKNAVVDVASALAEDSTIEDASDLNAALPASKQFPRNGSNGATIDMPTLNLASETFEICGEVPGGDKGAFCIDQDGNLTENGGGSAPNPS